MSFRLVKNLEEANAITHDGVFHADEVLGTALLSMVSEVRLLRARGIPAGDKCPDVIMYDMGGIYNPALGFYDHHQRDFQEQREDGTKYSSFGLLWESFGLSILLRNSCPPEHVQECLDDIDKRLVKWVDGRDNGQLPFSEEITVSSMISGFNPSWDNENPNEGACFVRAVEFAYKVLNNLIKSTIAEYKAIAVVEEKISNSDGKVLSLGNYVAHWQAIVLKSENPKAKALLYCTYKGKEDETCIVAVPPSLEEMTKQRKPFPEEWAGLSGEKLEAAAGIKGLKFCHAGRFFMSVESEEVAQEVLKKIL